MVIDKHEGETSLCLMPHKERKACIFEHIYFALPNSIVFGRSVYQSRYTYGRILAEEAPVECDVVIAVPDSGVVAALGFAAEANVPFQQGLIRSHYVGRTFIEPSQKIRDFGVKLKLAPVSHVLKGKRVVVVDDSIVRGTTSSKIVRLIKEAGATEVHMRIASPPITGSCYYGVDTPSKEELISYRYATYHHLVICILFCILAIIVFLGIVTFLVRILSQKSASSCQQQMCIDFSICQSSQKQCHVSNHFVKATT